jgi:hypothetical protein
MIVLLLLHAITESAFGDAIPISSIEARDPFGNGELIQTRTMELSEQEIHCNDTFRQRDSTSPRIIQDTNDREDDAAWQLR